MKYGETLKQRSIPAWQTHNIDYQDIKHFIKTNTTHGKGKAVAIPGSTDTNAIEFENRLFLILKEQDERITWFVRSKVGEIQRRLAHLEQQTNKFVARPGDVSVGRVTVKRLERYGRIESDVLKVGEEIQALSRFVGVQQEAFRKLLKKYKKWTGSSELGYRFEDEVRQRQSSFTRTDLKPFLDRYEELLHTIRALYEQSQRQKEARPKVPNRTWPDRSSSVASHFSHVRMVLENGKRVDFDHLLATLKVGEAGKNAVFWCHTENVVELQVLLSQYTRSFNACCRQPSIASITSSLNSPSLSQSTLAYTDTFDIVADEPLRFLSQLGLRSVRSVELQPDAPLQKAALHVRGNIKDDVALLAWNRDDTSETPEMETCAIKRKFVDPMIDRKGRLPAQKAAIQHHPFEGSAPTSTDSVEQLQEWLKSHDDVRPITTILSQRARFFNVANNNAGVLLASLDQSIQFQPGAACDPDGSSSSKFPHAILRVRQEGTQATDLIQILSSSHLVERVHGFSLEHHAVWQATQPPTICAPFWLPLLSQDLRKVPSNPGTLHKPSTEFGSQSTTPHMSTATSSEAGGQTSETVPAAPISKEKSKTSPVFSSPNRVTTKRKTTTASRLRNQRYYSEYDDPDASDHEDAYVIYIDPNEKSVFELAWGGLKRLFGKEEKMDPEREPLLYEPDLESPGDEGESSDEEEVVDYRISRIYGRDVGLGLEAGGQSKVASAWKSVPRLSATCFAASVSLLLVAVVLAGTGRKKLRGEVDAGVLFAVGMSLVFSVVGVASLYRSGEHLRGWVWAAAGVVVCVVAVGSGGLVAWTVS
ncbi:Vacuolar transporter chaperone 4 [Sphaceloma murrayae]|uniref:Vacuolar transporter chaperone 4 n=1 Tax=Sphaceloma murrayae TaxID=2082308 RepID=A0A2K1QGS2_9PEZI|nr:Vacuolar transporter chaperone 4 [Sphaceloma murrayae]